MPTNFQDVATTCTTLNEDIKTYVRLPPGAKGYLQEKVEYALKAPRLIRTRLSDGSTVDTFLKQIVVSTAIRLDETLDDFLRPYKAEVSFDTSPKRYHGAPIPFLSADKAEGPNRRHSLNPFPPGRKPGFLRRPDVIIVRDGAMRWPGRGNRDHDGAPQVDNLLRLVEIKFPGDDWGRNQEQDYRLIAGGQDRMSVIDVSDCDGELERAKDRLRNALPLPVPKPNDERPRLEAPVRTANRSLPSRVWYEEWVPQIEHLSGEVTRAVESLLASARRGVTELSAESQAWLRPHAPWLFAAGRWKQSFGQFLFHWLDEHGREVLRYTGAQLKAAWIEVQRATDLTWEVLCQVEWMQVATNLALDATAVAAVVLLVAGTYMVIVVTAAVVGALAALIALIGAGATAALGALLGGAVLAAS